MSLETIKERQPGVYQTLTNALRQERLAHAYLFEGHKGVGKRETVNELVKAFFCCEKKHVGCGSCHVCKRVMNGNHPDIVRTQPDGQHIKVDQIRLLKKEIAMSSVESDKRVYIIEHADRMNVQAANSLLKFLEEPSGKVLAVLLTEKPSGMLETIRSRVQTISFQQPNGKQFADKLMRDFGLKPDVAFTLASYTSDISEVEELMQDSWIQRAMSEISHFMQQVLEGNPQRFITVGHILEHFETKDQQLIALTMLSMWQRDILMVSINRSHEVINQSYLNDLKGLNYYPVNQDYILQAQRKIMSNVSAQLVFEQLCYRLKI
ncbi:DNA polymerase III subunit delta' (plasmid) [Alkalihalophilus sp. As8PL]|uniref:DNA polymerase III subunit delta n=1 Tax=Alkalihalophilus sp. As8PL TaxID=3237103 RepID=A0AB39BNS2_9BACI